MAEEQDDSQKTEDPTQKRLADALEKGDIIKSQEINNWVGIAAGTAVLAMFGGPMSRQMAMLLQSFIARPETYDTDPGALLQIARALSLQVGAILAMPALLFVLTALAGHVIQNRPSLHFDKIMPKLDKLNPLAGFKRVFGGAALSNFLKGLSKFTVVGLAAFFVLWPERFKLGILLGADPAVLLPISLKLSINVLSTALAILAIVAVLDYIMQRRAFYKRNRMTKQEVREEHRQSEGDPLVKGKIKQIRGERARRRMMAKVPQATVVVTNPTHFAVALQYETGKNIAPVCVAKGADKVALRIREVAKEHNVPIIEDPPLARVLYATVDLDQEVPPEHYKAVASVIGYVMRLKNRHKRPISR
jgi:flagellar biosynthetic protein FlhB